MKSLVILFFAMVINSSLAFDHRPSPVIVVQQPSRPIAQNPKVIVVQKPPIARPIVQPSPKVVVVQPNRPLGPIEAAPVPEPNPQTVFVTWPGGGYYGNFGPPFLYRRRPVIVAPAVYPVYGSYVSPFFY
ncbi:hypothetical protein PVAND_004967 [Polypedilum vanderplanki]|uniref:Uncharacterized protein n=1 Tax=Polypedilum vanderplanki TaxID=319348 RepID=A0A9J6BYQ7_POLVA|nr:hypothetical protein PVAND_004967 [Polypedilum vanderplanki]